MAITATFQADFTQFVTATQQADGKLAQLKESVGKIPPALNTIPPASNNAATSLGSFHTSLSAVDRTLASVGIQIGPQVRALQELASASGKTASQLGLVATAGVTVAAAMGGWQIGRMVADWFDLDESIANATASLLGFGDVAGQTAAAKLDVMARAQKLTTVEVTSFGQALGIITAKNAEFADSMNTATHRVSLWQGEIRKLRAEGTLDNLKADMEGGNSTLKELASHYGISTRAVEYFGRQNKETAEQVKAHTAEMTKASEAAEALTAAWIKANASAIAKTESDIRNAEGMVRMNDAIATQERALQNAEGEWLLYRDAAMMATAAIDAELQKEIAAVEELTTALQGLTIIGQKPGSSLSPEKPSGVTVFGGGGGQGISGADLSLYGASLKAAFNPGLRTSDLMSPFGANGAVTVNSTINVNGVFDTTAKRQLQEAVSEGLTRSILQGSKVS